MPRAKGRSKDVPSLRIPPGARFTVMRLLGTVNPEFLMAANTRSRASLTAESGRPTKVKPGNPGAISTSTVMGKASIPESAQEVIIDNIPGFRAHPYMSRKSCRATSEKGNRGSLEIAVGGQHGGLQFLSEAHGQGLECT